MHIPTISAKRDFNDEVGKIKSINTFSISKLSTIGITVGSARFRYAGNNKVEILGDKYDFDLRKGASLERNIATLNRRDYTRCTDTSVFDNEQPYNRRYGL